MLLHLGCDDDLKDGFENLDPKINGWTFESGLPYADDTVDGITISHALMYVESADWSFVCAELFRVLRNGGVVRITEDDTESVASPRFGVTYPGGKVATGPAMVRAFLASAGFEVRDCNFDQTYFQNDMLLIAHRERKKPKFVFYIEGIKGGF